MNIAFAGGGQASGAANTNYRFSHAGTIAPPHSLVQRRGHTADEIAMKTALHQGSADDLNIYIKLSDVNGYSTFPWGYAAKPIEDGIVSPAAALPGGAYSGEGMAHEAGHWLGLYHTFQGGCTQSNDFVSDTPAERVPNRLCPPPTNLDTCTGGQYKGKDPTNNFMDYTPEACATDSQPDRVPAWTSCTTLTALESNLSSRTGRRRRAGQFHSLGARQSRHTRHRLVTQFLL